MKFTVAKKAIALTGAVAMLGSVAACGSDTASGKPAQDKDVTEITVWAWEPTLTQVAKDFTKKTGIKVDLKNVGTNTKEYTQLDNAIEAGSGAPDIAQIEYYALPEYVIRGHLENLSDLGASDFKDFYTPGTWSSVSINDGVYALPMDSGPMAWFYTRTSSTRPASIRPRCTRGTTSTRLPRRFAPWTPTSPPIPVTPASSTP